MILCDFRNYVYTYIVNLPIDHVSCMKIILKLTNGFGNPACMRTFLNAAGDTDHCPRFALPIHLLYTWPLVLGSISVFWLSKVLH